ncbi:Protein kinase-like domain [Cordyceps militaris CM01]|uniref:non-specific serine/threonine protein kinase n=1 Tax=Cordyceps militaris (strain CM01) TaxID=983644 RepID=G3JUK9_CORMM|nr:Protein kinase-like domain [Cordyceps militaris CM01]EGX87745.1 Protein kinase-like domain [Cordyceps militaris CM01]
MSALPPTSAASVLPSSPPTSRPSSVPPPDTANDELVNVQSSDVTFLEILKTKIDKKNGNTRVITFKVEIDDRLCVMKVYKHNGYWHQFRSEESAYRLLNEKGFCERGLVPKFYGIIDSIDVSLWPELYQFENDSAPPSAIFIEYIQNAKKIDFNNYTLDKMDRLCAMLTEFHSVGLLHGDPYPRNMMVVPGTPRDRVFWLDFDSSSVEDRTTGDEDTERQFQRESREMACVAKAFSMDAKNGIAEETFNEAEAVEPSPCGVSVAYAPWLAARGIAFPEIALPEIIVTSASSSRALQKIDFLENSSLEATRLLRKIDHFEKVFLRAVRSGRFQTSPWRAVNAYETAFTMSWRAFSSSCHDSLGAACVLKSTSPHNGRTNRSVTFLALKQNRQALPMLPKLVARTNASSITTLIYSQSADSNVAKIAPLSLTPELDRIWKGSKHHDYGAHASIRTTNGNAFPIIKLAHPDDDISIKLIEREFNVLTELKKLELPVVDFDEQPITCDGAIYGYRMKTLTKLEPGEMHTRWEDVKGVFSLLHHAGFCHGDFNPSNIMKADNDRLIIIDFSFSGRIGSPVPPFMPTWRFPTGEYCLDQDVAALKRYALVN